MSMSTYLCFDIFFYSYEEQIKIFETYGDIEQAEKLGNIMKVDF